MRQTLCFLMLSVPACLAGQSKAVISLDGAELVVYQSAPLTNPKGGEIFQGSNFIHPLKTPSGFTVTDFQPDDHLHHFGLWWPWKYLEIEGRQILFWELQRGEGIVQAVQADPLPGGLLTQSVYLDRKASGGVRVRLSEHTRIVAGPVVDNPVRGYPLDLEITQRVVGDAPVVVSQYRYSGFGFRGTPLWKLENSHLLTSAGHERPDANGTPARWVRAEGQTDADAWAGTLLMSHPENHAYPEKIRTWNQQHGGSIFVNFNPVMDASWTLQPGQSYRRRYRVFVYDDRLSTEAAEALWQNYATEAVESVQ